MVAFIVFLQDLSMKSGSLEENLLHPLRKKQDKFAIRIELLPSSADSLVPARLEQKDLLKYPYYL